MLFFSKASLIILLIYILPIILILSNLISFNYRFHLLLIATLLLFIMSRIEQIKLKELGLKRQNLKVAIKDVLPITIILTSLMILSYFIQGMKIDNSAVQWQFYLFFIFISSPIQEFLYRGYLFHLFSKVGLNQWISIIMSALLYSFVHSIYSLNISILIWTFILGVFWGTNYAKYKNLYSVIFSHSVLGAVAILVGLI